MLNFGRVIVSHFFSVSNKVGLKCVHLLLAQISHTIESCHVLFQTCWIAKTLPRLKAPANRNLFTCGTQSPDRIDRGFSEVLFSSIVVIFHLRKCFQLRTFLLKQPKNHPTILVLHRHICIPSCHWIPTSMNHPVIHICHPFGWFHLEPCSPSSLC